MFSERRRNDSYAEEEPEWFSGGPTSQSETIELTGFDDKILEDDKRKSKRSRKRAESLKEGMSSLVCWNYRTINHVAFLLVLFHFFFLISCPIACYYLDNKYSVTAITFWMLKIVIFFLLVYITSSSGM